MTPEQERATACAAILRWRENPVAFVWENFKVDPDPWQQDVLRAFPDPAKPRISLQACAGPGKTAVESWCGWNFLSCYGDRDNHPQGAAVAITQTNLRDNLWKEYAKWQGVCPWLMQAFTWTAGRIFSNEYPATWFMSARSWPKSASPEEQGATLSGLHSKYVLAQADESGAIPTTVLRAAEQALSTAPKFGKIMQAGNPISLEGMLHAAASELRHQWHVIRVTGDPDDPKAWVHSPRFKDVEPGKQTPAAWAREQIATYGRENPWVMSYILGQFPPSSLNTLLGIEDVEAAMHRHLRSDQYEWAQKRIGVDVARYGDDRTVIFPRQGLASFRPKVLRHARDSAVSVDIANTVMANKARWGSELELFDATGGWAAGAVDVMRTNGHNPINVQFAAPAIDPRYFNRRAEIWFQMAEWVKAGGALPPVQELVGELTTPTYVFKNGKFLIEDKDLVKIKLGRSPDLADALALTFGMVEMPAAMMAGLQQTHHAARDADPFAVPALSAVRDADPWG